jgi:hypothetical protein
VNAQRQRVHSAVRRKYGRADIYECTDCPNYAMDWSHIHDTDPDNIDNYTPRCRSCHQKYDYADMIEVKENLSKQKLGVLNPNAKLSPEDVDEIRRLALNGYSGQYIANQYGISKRYANKIKAGVCRVAS